MAQRACSTVDPPNALGSAFIDTIERGLDALEARQRGGK
jgi:hypothetical protein